MKSEKKMYTFSVVIPHYNNIDGLKRLIKSLLSNKNNSNLFFDFLNRLKIIVVDDYSEKKYINEIRKLAVKYNFIFIQNNQKKSAGVCRNIGLSKVNTDYVIFADSDDFFVEEYWNLLIDFSKKDFDIAFFLPNSVYNDNVCKKSDRHIVYEKIIDAFFSDKNENYLRYTWNVPWSKIFRTKFLKDNKILFSDTIVSNDILFSAKSGYLANKILVSKKTFYIATTRSDSLVYKFNIENLKIRMKVGLDYKNFCEQIGYYTFPDNCLPYLFHIIYQKPEICLSILKYAKEIGVFKDKKYVLSYIATLLKKKLRKYMEKFKNTLTGKIIEDFLLRNYKKAKTII